MLSIRVAKLPSRKCVPSHGCAEDTGFLWLQVPSFVSVPWVEFVSLDLSWSSPGCALFSQSLVSGKNSAEFASSTTWASLSVLGSPLNNHQKMFFRKCKAHGNQPLRDMSVKERKEAFATTSHKHIMHLCPWQGWGLSTQLFKHELWRASPFKFPLGIYICFKVMISSLFQPWYFVVSKLKKKVDGRLLWQQRCVRFWCLWPPEGLYPLTPSWERQRGKWTVEALSYLWSGLETPGGLGDQEFRARGNLTRLLCKSHSQ